MNKHEELIYNFLHKCNFVFDKIEQLDGMMIPREMLLCEKKYNDLSMNILELKKMFSSSMLTSLQTNAPKKQKWPLLNLVRQILKSNDYKMEPIRKSAGYAKDGKKIYKRFFLIRKFKVIPDNLNEEINVTTE
jgi:hypothetical protein